ncbi:MAG: secreted protein [Conexibacter sp.]|nr:secreted protein [Conexibacter sp.]
MIGRPDGGVPPVHVGIQTGFGMSASRSRSVLSLAMLGCVAALLVALVVGNASEADSGTARSSEAPASEIASLRTENSRTFANADGSRSTRIYSQAVNYRDGQGAWQPIDTDLHRTSSGAIETTAAATDLVLPASLADPAKLTDGSRWVSFALRGADTGTVPDVAGAKATYGDVVGGVDASYEALASGVKETLTLPDASAPDSYSFDLKASTGLNASLLDDGSVAFVDADGHRRFLLPAPTVQEHGQAAPSTNHVTFHLSSDHRTLTVAVDPQWLEQAHFPVQIDPTMWTTTATACQLSSGASAGVSDCGSATMNIGHVDGSSPRTDRVVLRFNDLSAVPQTASIIDAQVYVQLKGTGTSTGPTTGLDAYDLTKQVTAGASWNTYDGTHAWTTAGGDVGSTPIDAISVAPTDDGFPAFDTNASTHRWLRQIANNGILIKAHDETAASTIVMAGPGATNNDGDLLPALTIDWEAHPGFERDQTLESQAIDDRSSIAVNVASGNMAADASDIALPGVAGMGLTIGRTYNSTDLTSIYGTNGAVERPMGNGWTTTINGASVTQLFQDWNHGRAIFAQGGAIYRFDRDVAHDNTSNGDLAFTTPPGIDADLVRHDDGSSTLTYRKTGTVWTYQDGNGPVAFLAKIADRHGNHIDIAHRSDNQVDHITDTYGRTTTFHYSASDLLTSITNGTRTWSYGVAANATATVLQSFANPDTKTTNYTYDTTNTDVPGRITKITDARNHDITVTYGTGANAYKVTKITRVVDGTTTNDVSWQYNYAPATGTGDTCTATDVIGRTVETDPEGHLTTYCYNNNGQVIQTFDANHRSVAATYNAAANVATFTDLAGTGNPSLTTYSFSPAGNATGASTPTGAGHTQSSVIKYCGTASGDTGTACSSTDTLDQYRPKVTTDSQGTSQAFGYNAAGDLNDVTTTSGSDHQQLHYTAAGEVDSSTDGNGRVTSYDYTTVSHFLSKVTPPAPLAIQKFTADSLSRVASATDGNGITACPTYDGEDRTTQVVWRSGVTAGTPCSTGTVVKTMSFTYDANGNVTQRVEGANTTTYGYDNLNRRTTEAFPGSRTNAYVYDRASNLKSVTDPDGVVSYTYDPANRLATITSPKPTSGTDTITYSYTDPAAATDPSKQTITFPGGLKKEATTDAAGNVLAIKILNSSSTVVKSRSYTHDRSSSATSALVQSVTDDAGNVTTYTHGAADRLTKAKTMNGTSVVDQWDYLYDAAGNRTRRTYTSGTATPTATSYAYNTANELCWSIPGTTPGTPTPSAPCNTGATGATNYTYDNNGQRTTGATFDALERMTALGSDTLGYLSPGNGELVSYGNTGYQNNLMGLARQIPSSGSATDIIHTPDGAPIAQRVGTTSKQSLFADALGSTIAMADDGANTLSRHYSYTPDGVSSTSGSGATTNLLFASGHQVGNLYHFGARYYDPTTATWTQQDPINQISSLTEANHYSYVGGDPVNHVDRAGMCFVLSCKTYHKLGNAAKKAGKDTLQESAGCVAGAYAGAEYGAAVLEPEAGAVVGCAIGAAGTRLGVDFTEPSRTGQP